MKKILASTLFVAMVSACAQSVIYATEKPVDQKTSLDVLSAGPLRFVAVHNRPIFQDYVSVFDVSPDGRLAAALHGALTISPVSAGKDVSQTTGLADHDCTASGASPILRWSKDSHFLWTARRTVQQPSGFATSGLQPIQFFATGEVKALPALSNKAGLLDEVLFVGDKGLALTAFGMKGGYYRPERQNPDPTLAIVDTTRGAILDTVSVSKLAKEAQATIRLPDSLRIANAAAAVLPDGRLKVLIDFLNLDRWIVWTQGEKAYLLPSPSRGAGIQIAMAPNGQSVLVVKVLRTEGALIREDHTPGNTHGGYVPGKPVQGVLAVLHDLKAKKDVWSTYAKVTSDSSGTPPPPVISADGRFALIRLPADKGAPYIALVSMRDGKILQHLPIAGKMDSSQHAMGFYSKGVWTRSRNSTAFYAFKSGK